MDRFATWLGLLFAVLAMVLTLAALPPTWASQHHSVYVLLWVAVWVCAGLAAAVPCWHGWRCARFRWMVWRAAKTPLHAPDIVSNPGSPTDPRSFKVSTTRQRRKHIRTASRPAGLRITAPVEVSVWVVPFEVRRYGKTIFRVSQFLPDGFVIEDASPGLRIEGEVSYSELPSRPR